MLNLHLNRLDLTLDPHRMEDMYSMFVVIQIHRGLVRYLPDGRISPDLSSRWEESLDRKRYVFRLRDSKFSDGKPIRAAHVVNSFRRMFKNRNGMAGDMQYVDGVRVIGDDAVEFTLKHPSALFLKHLAAADCAVMSLDSPDAVVAINERSAVSGPFKPVAVLPNEIVLEKWRADLQDSANPPKRVRFFPTPANVAAAAIAGETVSLANDRVEAVQVEELKGNGWHEVVGGLARERFVVMNPKLVSLNVRKWLFHRVFPENLLPSLNLPRLVPAYGLIPSTLPGHLELGDVAELRGTRPDPPDRPLEFNLDYPLGDPSDEAISQALKREWETGSLKIRLKGYPTAEYLDRLFQGKSHLILGKKGMDYPDGFSTLGYFQKGYAGSYFHVTDDRIDQMVGAAAAEFSETARLKLYREAQKEILARYTVIPISFGSSESGLWGRAAKFVPPHPMGFHTIPLELIELDP